MEIINTKTIRWYDCLVLCHGQYKDEFINPPLLECSLDALDSLLAAETFDIEKGGGMHLEDVPFVLISFEENLLGGMRVMWNPYLKPHTIILR